MLGPQARPSGVTVDFETPDQKDDSDDQKRRQRNHLDQRGPELQLAEGLHRDHVQRHHGHQCDQCDRPLRYRLQRCPVMEVICDRGGIHDGGHRPVQEIHPPRDERHFLAEELARIRHERARRRAAQHQFAERAQDQENETAAESVDQEQPGSRRRQSAAGAQEQARSRWRRRSRSSVSAWVADRGGSRRPHGRKMIGPAAGRAGWAAVASSSFRRGATLRRRARPLEWTGWRNYATT